jgi:hypothetical protein
MEGGLMNDVLEIIRKQEVVGSMLPGLNPEPWESKIDVFGME